MKRNTYSFTFLLAGRVAATACEACEKQQPAFTRGITHGAGPESSLDWVIVAAMVVVSVVVLIFSVKYLLRPREDNKAHIKHSIFD